MATEQVIVHGSLDAPTFLPWAKRHSRWLGLRCIAVRTDATRVEFRVEGQIDLIDAFEVGCLLGPIDVWVDRIERHPKEPMPKC